MCYIFKRKHIFFSIVLAPSSSPFLFLSYFFTCKLYAVSYRMTKYLPRRFPFVFVVFYYYVRNYVSSTTFVSSNLNSNQCSNIFCFFHSMLSLLYIFIKKIQLCTTKLSNLRYLNLRYLYLNLIFHNFVTYFFNQLFIVVFIIIKII
jgi:hypothetical protein